MTQRQSFSVLLIHAIVAVSILAAATFLCAYGKLDASAVVALFGTAIALLGVNSQQLGQQIVNGGSKPDLNKLATQDPAMLERLMASQNPMTTTTTAVQPPPVPAEPAPGV